MGHFSAGQLAAPASFGWECSAPPGTGGRQGRLEANAAWCGRRLSSDFIGIVVPSKRNDERRSVLDPKFAIDLIEVRFYGPIADAESTCDYLVRNACTDQGDNLSLTFRENARCGSVCLHWWSGMVR